MYVFILFGLDKNKLLKMGKKQSKKEKESGKKDNQPITTFGIKEDTSKYSY